MNICPVCFREASIKTEESSFNRIVTCNRCGTYYLFDGMEDLATKSGMIRASMYYYLTHFKPRQRNRTVAFYSNTPFDNLKDKDKHVYISLDSLLNNYPENLNKRFDFILMNLAAYCGGLGKQIIISKPLFEELRNIFFIKAENITECMDEIDLLLEYFSGLNFIKKLGSNIYKLTSEGWIRVQELQHANKLSQKAFIAMWFDECMNQARDTIINAIQNSGYTPIIINLKEHNNQIVPEILYEIESSLFIVADLTGHRNGVYYEAGYAQALGKTVILSCREGDFNDRHFDVAQINTIKWTDETDLYTRLTKRIEATVGSNKNTY